MHWRRGVVFDWSIYPIFRLQKGGSSQDEEKLPVGVGAALFWKIS